jgi:hypothetical protein
MPHRRRSLRVATFCTVLSCATSVAPAFADSIGVFSQASDVGTVSRPTDAKFDSTSGAYVVGASGANMWAEQDAFGFVWKKHRGDLAISASIRLEGTSAQNHRKAGLMFRESLAADSVYADVVVHGDGLTSLQFRTATGGPTREVQCATTAPAAVRLDKRGDYVMLSVANVSGAFEASGCSIRIAIRGAFYAGLAVCAHDNTAFEVAKFRNVRLAAPPLLSDLRTSAIEIVPLASLDRRVIWRSTTHLDAASFTATGDAVCFRNDGQLQRLVLDGKSEPVIVDAQNAADCVVASTFGAASSVPMAAGKDGRAWLPKLSPDGKLIAYLYGNARGAAGNPVDGDYLLRAIPVTTGDPRDLAHFVGGPGSFGVSPWSPDGTRIVFVSREPE